MPTPPFISVRIGSHLNGNAFMYKLTTKDFHVEEVPKLVYTLFWCKPVLPPLAKQSHTSCVWKI